ncbi:MAG: CHAP domain-containing protein [Lachnospiraceae bacterium]
MPKIKTRKAIQESARQVRRMKQTSKEENTPESTATSNVENTAKYTAQDTARYLGHQVKKHTQPSVKKPKAKQDKQYAKAAQKTTQAAKVIGEAVVSGVKATAKAVAAAGKALASAIASGGWIAVVVIILVVCLVVFLGAFFFTEEGGGGFVAVALSQVGNVGGEPYWSWYGYTSRVEWCACFVSWCGEQCGYLKAEIIPKYDNCANGVAWFQEREQWLDGLNEPTPGMIIFFDWDTEETNGQDGIPDHTGIVTEVEDGLIKTVEGNSNDSVEKNEYTVGNAEILGYGVLLYIQQKDAARKGGIRT